MTTTTTPPVRPFASLRIDPTKAAEGVWIEHPDSHDRVRIRRRLGRQHAEAYSAALIEYEQQHGEGTGKSREADHAIDAVAMARGIVVDWQLVDDPRPYDAAEMAEMLTDPEMADLRRWIERQSDRRDLFRPTDEAAR
jgi:hypothetical protein